MKVLGERISILKKDNLLSIVILPGLDRKRLALIFLWLLAWTVCGLIVMVNYFQATNPDVKLFIIVFLSFWIYFEYNVVRAFMWKRSGKEKIWIQNGKLHYQKEINNRGKILEFDCNLISNIEIVELKSTRFADTLNQSFWVKGGERLAFDCQGKNYRFGMQITEQQARELRKEINQSLR